MKKFLALALAVLMISALAVSASAYFYDRNESGKTITYTINQPYTPWAADGVISEGEYFEVAFADDDLSIAVADEAETDNALNCGAKLYMSYDADYVYVAAVTSAKDFICQCDDDSTMIWGSHAIQLSFAAAGEEDASMRLETGYALSSDTGALLFSNWNDGMGISYDGSANKDFTVVNDGTNLIYEMRVPYSAFQTTALSEGSSILFCIVWATGTSEGTGSDAYRHLQLAYGCTGDPGKDVTGHAVITLGEKIEAPVVEEEVVEEAAGEDVVVDTPVTADAGIVAAVAVMAVAAGVVLSKKH